MKSKCVLVVREDTMGGFCHFHIRTYILLVHFVMAAAVPVTRHESYAFSRGKEQ